MPMTSITNPTITLRRKKADARSTNVSYGVAAMMRRGVFGIRANAATYRRPWPRVYRTRFGGSSGSVLTVGTGNGRPLRLANGRVVNPRGLRTGGVPPYTETRGYVAVGTRLYRALVEAGHLATDPPLPHDAGASSEAPRGATTGEREPPRSLYFFAGPGAGRAVELPGDEEVAETCAFLVTGSRSPDGATTGSIRYH